MPTLIHINGEAWAVKLAGHGAFDKPTRVGNTNCATREILLLKELTPYEKADILLHEVQHAFTCENNLVHNDRLNNDGLDEHCDGHCGIYFAGPKWHQLIRDNPELIKFVIDTDPQPLDPAAFLISPTQYHQPPR